MTCRLFAPPVEIAALEQVDDAPVPALQLELSIGSRLGGGDHGVGRFEALQEAVGPPQGDVARAQRRRDRSLVGAGLGNGDSLLAQPFALFP